MSFSERVLHTITDPNIAYILFTLGVIGIIAELYSPGAIFPGVTGGIALLLALVAFGQLPVSWGGIALILLSFGLLVAELFTTGFGVLGVGGVIAFVLGSLMLYSPLQPVSPAGAIRISPWVIGTMAALVAGFFFIVVRSLLRSRKQPVRTGIQALLGRTGTAKSDLDPSGEVQVAGETWTAVAKDVPIEAGHRVRVVAVEGVTLYVVQEEASGAK